jgi:hypothetical protein
VHALGFEAATAAPPSAVLQTPLTHVAAAVALAQSASAAHWIQLVFVPAWLAGELHAAAVTAHHSTARALEIHLLPFTGRRVFMRDPGAPREDRRSVANG